MVEEKKISTGLATAVGLGAIIGAGIFVLSGTAIALAGSNALFAFLLVGIVAFMIALEFGELGSILPYSKGASYSYVYKAFGSELGFITGILQYFSFSTSISVIALGFGTYFASIFGLSAALAPIEVAIALIFILSIVNAFGIRSAARADFLLVALKIGVLIVFIAFAMLTIFGSHANTLSNFTVSSSQSGIAAIFAASIAIFFAYSGFQTIATFTSKVKGGAGSAAKAIVYSVIISIVLYVLVVYSLLLLVPASQYSISADPLSFALAQSNAPSWLVILVDIGALLATASATLAMILSSSRMLYQISHDKLLPSVLAAYDKKRDVAIDGIIISAVIGVIMLFSGNIYVIAAISNFGLLFSYLMASLALLHFRRNHESKDFRTPAYPWFSIVIIVALLIFMTGLPYEALIIGILMIISLTIIYYMLREMSNKRVIRVKLFR